MVFLCKIFTENFSHLCKLIALLWEQCNICFGGKKYQHPIASSKETGVLLNGFTSQMQCLCDLHTFCILVKYSYLSAIKEKPT